MPLAIIPESSTQGRSVLLKDPGSGPFFKGHGPLNFVCGNCRTVLVEGYGNSGGITGGLVMRCTGCQRFNEWREYPSPPASVTG